MAKILVVDDDQGMREFLEILLVREGYEVISASGAITDLMMPKINGIDVLKSIKEVSPKTLVILITGYASGETAIAAMKEGAYDYLEKNFDLEDLKAVIKDALSKKGVKEEDAVFMKDVEDALCFGNMIGKSKGMLKVYSLVRKVANTAANILITGESGTGKELVAGAIHENSSRKDKPFVIINCGGIPENLLESGNDLS